MDLKEQLTKLLCASVNDTFSVLMNITPEITTAKFMPSQAECIMSTIGFKGSIDGSFIMCFECQSALKVVSKMLQMIINDISTDVTDGIGELCNMISGGVKMKLAGSDHSFEISIPATVKGSRLEVISDNTKVTNIMINFTCDDFRFTLVLLYKVNEVRNGADAQKGSLNAADRLAQLMKNTQGG